MKLTTKDILGKWKEYTLTNNNDMSVSVLNFGGIITKIMVPDRSDLFSNVVLSYKDYEEYELNTPYFGAIIGRVAGRIEGASFQLDNKIYQLDANDGKNHLHGGPNGFHLLIWEVRPFQTCDKVGLELTHKSVDGEGGYPGNVEVIVTYSLNNNNQLILNYSATSDQTTPFTLTNHSYFNLSGDIKRTVHDHFVTIDSNRFVELNQHLIPTGKQVYVDGTPFDFRNGLNLGTGFKHSYEQNRIVGNGYDHYFIFNNTNVNQTIIDEPHSGRRMCIKTNQPGMVMYTGNTLNEGLQLREGISQKHLGVCFETQASPASLHHEGFPSIILKAGEIYEKQTVFTFSVAN